jgi:hypothetical protein
MSPRTHTKTLAVVLLLLAAIVVAGCSNPDAPTTTTGTSTVSSPQNPGEPTAPAPAAPATQTPIDVQPTPTKAIEAFAELYVNWTYQTLTSNQRTLAAISVGAARLAERQAAASSEADTTIARGHIYNQGQILSIAPDSLHPGMWVIVAREQTGGSSEYAGLPAAYHVTLAQLAHLSDGYAVSQWLPQS